MIVGPQLTEEQELLRRTIRQFVDEEISPYVRDWEHAGEHPESIYDRMAELGILGAPLPQEYGGLGLDGVTYAVITEELARGCSSLRTSLSVHASLAGTTIKELATDEQKQRWLPLMATGEKSAAWALTEPGSGSDVAGMSTTAKLDGDHYILNGSKAWISNGGRADYIVVYAKTNPDAGHEGISCFLVEKEFEGFACTGEETRNKLGLRSSPTATLSFDNCRVPVANRIGDEGSGWRNAMLVLNHGRTSVAAGGVGIAQAALEAALDYAAERKAFGKPIAAFQLVQAMLAEMDVDIAAARLLVHEAARMKDRFAAGEVSYKDWTQAVSRAKLYAAEMSNRVCDKAIQVHGANGYTDDYPVERYWRDARVLGIYEGTNQIQRLILGRLLTGERA